MFSHEVQIAAIDIVCKNMEGLDLAFLQYINLMIATMAIIFIAERIVLSVQASRLETFVTTQNVQEDNMTDQNTDTATTSTNLFTSMRAGGYKAVDKTVDGMELVWLTLHYMATQTVKAGKFVAVEGAILLGCAVVIGVATAAFMVDTIGEVLKKSVLGWKYACEDVGNALISGYRKVTGWFSTKKAQAKAWVAEKVAARAEAKAAAKAEEEAARIETLKADAALIGMVTSEEVAEMVGAVLALVKASNKEMINAIAMMDATIPAVPLHLEPIVAHAQVVVAKAVDEMDLAEMREELGVKGFNTNQLRAKVRTARANS